MLELGTFGSVRGVPGNGYPYRNPRPVAVIDGHEFTALKLPPQRKVNRRPAGRREALPTGRPC